MLYTAIKYIVRQISIVILMVPRQTKTIRMYVRDQKCMITIGPSRLKGLFSPLLPQT